MKTNFLAGLSAWPIACSVAAILILPEATLAACYLNTDANSACATGSARSSLGWTPNAAARDTLLQSVSVQKTLNGCELMAKLVKSECQPFGPVLSIYSSDSGGIEVESAVIEISALMPNDITLPTEFRVYFQQAAVAANLARPSTPATPAVPVVPQTPQMKVPTAPPRSKALYVKAAEANDGILDTIIKMITPAPAKTCSFGGRTYSVGSGVMAFEAPTGTVCRSAMRTCQADGTVSASTYNSPSCVTVAPPPPPTPAPMPPPAPAPVPAPMPPPAPARVVIPAPAPGPVPAPRAPVKRIPKSGKFVEYER